MADKQPHILILMTDQQRADCMSCAGHPMLKTPNMDRIADEGAYFEEAVTVSPVCMPARASFVNGLYPHNHGMWFNQGRMPVEDETFFHYLQKAGYATAHIGKSHYYNHKFNKHLKEEEPYMQSRGLEHVHETTGPQATLKVDSYMTDWWKEKGVLEAFREDYAARHDHPGWYVKASPHSEEDFQDSYVGMRAVEYIEQYDDERPSCTFVGFGGPHNPFDAPGKYADMYKPEDTPASIPVPEGLDQLPDHIRESWYYDPKAEMGPEDISKMQANYFGKVKLLDDWFGRIFDAYEKRGWLDDLVIVFWSDHGEMLGDHGKIYKSVFHESSLRIPLMVRWPGKIKAGTRSKALAEIIDIFPTLLDGLGLECKERNQGCSLWPVIEDADASLREFQLSEIGRPGGRRIMIRNHKYKYAVDDQARGFMLFDLEQDPTEQNNLIGKEPELEKKLRDKLLERIVTSQFSMGDWYRESETK